MLRIFKLAAIAAFTAFHRVGTNQPRHLAPFRRRRISLWQRGEDGFIRFFLAVLIQPFPFREIAREVPES